MFRSLQMIAAKAGILRCKHFREIAAATTGKSGLEIGGPSSLFGPRGLLPLYPLVASLDNINFASETVWSSAVEGSPYLYRRGASPGRQYIRDAAQLTGIEDNKYSFVLASHALEHIANPLKALIEWRRVLEPNGTLVVILPHRKYTFDHRRPYTTFSHLLEDFERDTPESDLTHLEEILQLHDLKMDKPAGTSDNFRARSLKNLENRCLHHHVFDPDSLPRIFSFSGFHLAGSSLAPSMHIIAFGRRTEIK